jgi:membrane protein YdbS with pleckstrin-like domain
MAQNNRDLEKIWRIVGWVFAAVALVIVAGPQILALFVG